MRKVYEHENLALVNTARNLLELSNIACFIKNEYHGGGGHVGLSSVPIELWVHDSGQAEQAISLLERKLDPDRQGDDWRCEHCGEINGAAFDVCWQCQRTPDHPPDAS